MFKYEKTQRGFERAEFQDRYDIKCSIQDSSLATEAAIWLGPEERFGDKEKGELYKVHDPQRMHLTQDMAAKLILVLQRFVETGSIGYTPDGT